jgi:hypothetical protein
MRRSVALRLATVSGCGALTLTACAGDDGPPTTSLLDGSRAVAPPVTLEGVGGSAIMARVVVVPRRGVAAGSAESECLRGSDDGGVGPLVVRVGEFTKSVTFRAVTRHALVACDGVGGRADDAWCGRAFGLLRGGGSRLGDPRLDLACARPDGSSIAFAWIEPSSRARYIAVEERGYVEVYTMATGLPVRIVTTDVDVSSSSASFAVSEHDRAGRLLRRYRLDATVAD